MSFGGGGSSGTTTTTAQPYAPAEPALNQILSEAGLFMGKDQLQQVMYHLHNKLYKVYQHKKQWLMQPINRY